MKMKKEKLSYFYLFFFIILCFYSYSLGITSNTGTFLEKFDFEPNKKLIYDYQILANDGYTADYEFFVETKNSKVDLNKYVKIEPDKFYDVPTGEKRAFKVILELPERIDSPGENEINVWLRGIEKDSGGGLVARPVVGLRYLIFVLYPWKAIDYNVYLEPMNLNEKKDFIISVRNIGEPEINKVYADIDIYNINNELIKQIKTNEIYNLKPKETKELKAAFDANGLLASNYYANVYVHYDNNVSNTTYPFVIGQKNVEILNFTKLIEYNQINEFQISVESKWNNKLEKVYANIDIYSADKKNKLASFKSLDTSLERLESKTIIAYFDARNLEKGRYYAIVNLYYDGSSSSSEDFITIAENVNLNVYEEIPGKFSFKNFVQGITLINVLIFFLIIFVLLSLYLGYTIIKHKINKKNNEQLNESSYDMENNLKKENIEESFDQETIEKIKDLQKLFSDEEIKQKLIKKGWNKEKVEKLFIEVNKKK